MILENYPSLLLSRSLSESARLASLASDNDIKEIIHATTHFTPSTPATSPSSPPVLMSMRLERVPENPTEKVSNYCQMLFIIIYIIESQNANI